MFLDIIDLYTTDSLNILTLQRVFNAIKPSKGEENRFKDQTNRIDKVYYTKQEIKILAEKVFT